MSHARRVPAGTIVVVISAALTACAAGPDYRRPSPEPADAYLPPPRADARVPQPSGTRLRFDTGTEPDDAWWTTFGPPPLQSLVSEALRNNPSLRAADANTRAARETAAAQRGTYWPQMQAQASAARQRDAIGVLSPTLGSGAPVYTLLTPQLSIGFVPDLFGANRRATESLAAAATAAGAQRDAARIVLAGNVLIAAVEISGLHAQLQATYQLIERERDLLAVLERELDLGAVSGLDVESQRALLAQSEAALPALEHALEQQRSLLAVLCGRLPQNSPAIDFGLEEVAAPATVPVGLPSRLVERRPDVRAAEAQLHAAAAEVGVATAGLLPQITLAGGLGSSATRVQDLFAAGTTFWTAGATLTQTLFAGGSLRHRHHAAQAQLDAAGAQYRAIVLGAFQNVADALHALQSDTVAFDAARRAHDAASAGLAIVQRQLELGAVSGAAVLLAEQTERQTETALLQARVSRLIDTLALRVALGGTVPEPQYRSAGAGTAPHVGLTPSGPQPLLHRRADQ